MEKLSQLIVRTVLGHPKTCFSLCILLCLALLPGLRLAGESYDIKGWFHESSSYRKDLEAFEDHFGNDEKIVIAVHDPNGIFDPQSIKIIREITDQLWQFPRVVRVDSLANYNFIEADRDNISVTPFLDEVAPLEEKGDLVALQRYLDDRKEKALAHESLKGRYIDEDAQTSLIFISLAPNFGKQIDYTPLVKRIEELVKKYNTVENHVIHLGGSRIYDNYLKQTGRNELKIALPIFMLWLLLFLFFTFRSFTASLFPFVVTVMTTLMVFGTCFYFGFPYSLLLQMLPITMISIAVADCIHILISYYQFRGENQDRCAAVRLSLEKNIIPSILTTVSTMIGFFSFIISDILPVKHFGLLGGIGCLLAWLLTIFMVCPALLWLNIKTPKFFTRSSTAQTSELFKKITSFIERQKRGLVIISLFVGIVTIVLASKNKVDSSPENVFKSNHPVMVSFNFFNQNFGSISGPELMINSGQKDGIKSPEFLSKVATYKEWLNRQDFIYSTVDIINIIKEMNQNFHGGDKNFYRIPSNKNTVSELLFLYTISLPQGMDINDRVSADYHVMRMSIAWERESSQKWLERVDIIQQKASELGLNVKVSGKKDLHQRVSLYMISSFFNSVGVSLILITILMSTFLSSLKMGLMSMLTNALPLLFGGMIMYLTGMNLSIGTILVVAVCLGIVVDDTIHFLTTYYRQRKKGADERQAIANTLYRTGSALTATTILLVVGFGTFLFSDLAARSHFGLTCMTILTMALLIDIFVLPAALFMLERRSRPR